MVTKNSALKMKSAWQKPTFLKDSQNYINFRFRRVWRRWYYMHADVHLCSLICICLRFSLSLSLFLPLNFSALLLVKPSLTD